MTTQMQRKYRWNVELLMRPTVFISASVMLSFLFSLQEWISAQRMGTHLSFVLALSAWGFHYFLWGAIMWSIWALCQEKIRNGNLRTILLSFLPLSILISILEEMAFLLVFVNLPVNHPHLGYWKRLTLYLYSDLLGNMIFFWCGFFLFRGVSYYELFRENEQVAAQLEVQLGNARLSALRMQLNPHFLFNTMNGISSLMRVDIEAADRMLEQLSFLMRITIERGDAQLITLRDEMEFIETYLAMQESRYKGRVVQSVQVAPELYEALVPTMLLQPLVENAFKHGLSKVISGGKLEIEIGRDADSMRIVVRNNGVSLRPQPGGESDNHGVGLANVQSRLRLHYGGDFSFSLDEPQSGVFQVTIRLPLQFSQDGAAAELIESVE